MRDVAGARRQRLEDRIEPVDHGLVAADHHAIAALDAPDAAGGADIEIMDAARLQRLAAADVVLPEGVAAVDDDVAGSISFASASIVSSVILPAGSITQAVRGFSSFLTKSSSAFAPAAPSAASARDRLLVLVVDDGGMAMLHQPADDVASHPPQADHSELHG